MTPQTATARALQDIAALAAPLPETSASVATPASSPTRGDRCETAATGPMPPRVTGPVAATGPDGDPYSGDLIADILIYRSLRWRCLRGEIMTAEDITQLAALEAQLRHPDGGDPSAGQRRMFRRYQCRFPARILFTDGQGVPTAAQVTVEDMSAGGVKLAWGHRLDAGAQVEIEVAVAYLDRVVRLPARVAWTREGVLGLMFAGAAS